MIPLVLRLRYEDIIPECKDKSYEITIKHTDYTDQLQKSPKLINEIRIG